MNRIELIGRVGYVSEYSTQDGGKFVKVSLATSERYVKDGERVEHTEWHSLIFSGKLADVVSRYVGKGKQLFVEGRMRYRKYADRLNIERTAAEVVVTGMEMLGGGDTGTNNDDS